MLKYLQAEEKKREKEEMDEKAMEGAQKLRKDLISALDESKYKTPVMERETFRRHILSMSLFPNVYNRNMVMTRY